MKKFFTIISAIVSFTLLASSKLLGPHDKKVNKPEKRVYHTLVYHDELKKTILLDGYHRPDGTPEYGDLWTWDGIKWQMIPDKGPVMRFGGAIAFDTKRKKLVLFGGLNASGPGDGKLLNDTWEWDPVNKWKRFEVAGPSARAWHAMAYDGQRNKIVLFGGATGFGKTAFSETWEWDGQQWEKINATNGPGSLCDLAMVYDDRIKKIILFGGQPVKADEDEKRKDSGDTWTWDGREWQRVNDKGLFLILDLTSQ